MDSITFIQKYPEFLEMIKKVSKEKYYPILEKLMEPLQDKGQIRVNEVLLIIY